MPGSTPKKVIAIRFDREPLTGYVRQPESFLPDSVQLLSAAGAVVLVPYVDLKLICFVRDWDVPAGWAGKRAFTSRPKLDGLWVRFDFRDGETLEGLLSNRLHELDGLGFHATPPDATGNTQRIYVPRAALKACTVLGSVGAAKAEARRRGTPEGQLTMFE